VLASTARCNGPPSEAATPSCSTSVIPNRLGFTILRAVRGIPNWPQIYTIVASSCDATGLRPGIDRTFVRCQRLAGASARRA
jgi:hypothetical protein